jgi:uncharacterized membrane protein
MRHFKLPLIATAITFVVALIAGIAIVTMIHRAKISDREKKARAEKLGGGVGIGVLIIITPFWLVGASRYGKERKAALETKPQQDQQQDNAG